jgi:hypothetical protein
MPTPKKLWKSTIVIWSDFDPQKVELADLAREATDGGAYCSKQKARFVKVAGDEDWDGTEFFNEE